MAQTLASGERIEIAGGGGLSELFMTHPPLEKRIAALEAMR